SLACDFRRCDRAFRKALGQSSRPPGGCYERAASRRRIWFRPYLLSLRIVAISSRSISSDLSCPVSKREGPRPSLRTRVVLAREYPRACPPAYFWLALRLPP